MATPYWTLSDTGYNVQLASPRGGEAPIDAGSRGDANTRKPAVQRFMDDASAMAKVHATHKISDINPEDYSVVFLAGGHGTMWYFTDSAVANFVGRAWDADAIVGAVCHGPAGLVNAIKANGDPVVKGLRVNSFTDREEHAVELENDVPFLLETELRKKGAIFESTDNFQSHAVRDGRLVTGQNPASVHHVSELLLEALYEKRKSAA